MYMYVYVCIVSVAIWAQVFSSIWPSYRCGCISQPMFE